MSEEMREGSKGWGPVENRLVRRAFSELPWPELEEKAVEEERSMEECIGPIGIGRLVGSMWILALARMGE